MITISKTLSPKALMRRVDALETRGPVERVGRGAKGFAPTGDPRSLLEGADGLDAGWEIVCAAPRSIALAARLLPAPAIVEAHRKAVLQAFARAEESACARRPTGGRFVGALAALAGEAAEDEDRAPALATHLLLVNFSEAGPLDPRTPWAAWSAMSRVYGPTLARLLRTLGYPLRRESETRYELAELEAEAVERFYQRPRWIERARPARGGVHPPWRAQAPQTAERLRLAGLEDTFERLRAAAGDRT